MAENLARVRQLGPCIPAWRNRDEQVDVAVVLLALHVSRFPPWAISSWKFHAAKFSTTRHHLDRRHHTATVFCDESGFSSTCWRRGPLLALLGDVRIRDNGMSGIAIGTAGADRLWRPPNAPRLPQARRASGAIACAERASTL